MPGYARFLLPATAAALTVALMAPAARAAPGDLDPSFGSGGKVVVFADTTPGDSSTAQALALQPDGKIVLAGQGGSFFGLVRLTPAGALDASSFGSGGRVLTSGTYEAHAVALQSDGRIVAAGEGHSPIGDAVRYLPSGAVDAGTFAPPTGISELSFPGSIGLRWTGVAQQPDGKLLLAGSADFSSLGNPADIAMARLDTSGHLDPSFNGGKFLTPIGSSTDHAVGMALQPDGRVVVAATTWDTARSAFDAAVVRYLPNGALDPSFGSGGKAVFPIGDEVDDDNGALALQPDGRIVVVFGASRSGTGGFGVARLNGDGTLDPAFGAGGTLLLPIGGGAAGTGGTANAVLVQPDGQIVIGGVAISGGSHYDFGLACLNPDGSPSASFGTNGLVTTVMDAARSAQIFDLALQPDGKIVAAGEAYPGPYAMAAARYQGCAPPPPSGTPAGASGGTGTPTGTTPPPPPPPFPSPLAPALRGLTVPHVITPAAARRPGIPVTIDNAAAGSTDVVTLLGPAPRHHARSAAARRVVVGTTTAHPAAAGKATLHVRLTRAAYRRLRHARTTHLVVRVRVTAPARATTTRDAAIVLRRRH